MIIGRKNNKIKIKTGGSAGLRAVECACCGPCAGCGSISQNTGGATDLSISVTAAYVWYEEEVQISESDLFTFYANPCTMSALRGSFTPYGCQEAYFNLRILKKSEGICVAQITASAGDGMATAGSEGDAACALVKSIEGSKIVPVNQILGTHSMTNLSGLDGAEPISLIVTIS